MKLRILCPISSGFVIIFRQAIDRTISLIDEHSYEAVQPPRERAQRGVPTYSKLCLKPQLTISHSVPHKQRPQLYIHHFET